MYSSTVFKYSLDYSDFFILLSPLNLRDKLIFQHLTAIVTSYRLCMYIQPYSHFIEYEAFLCVKPTQYEAVQSTSKIMFQ